MRISDWSSDVCSSDLTQYRIPAFARFDGWYTLNANLREEDFGAFDNSRTIEVAANRNARFGDWGVTVGAWGQQQSFSALDAPRTITTVWYPELSLQTVRARDPVHPRRGWSQLGRASCRERV